MKLSEHASYCLPTLLVCSVQLLDSFNFTFINQQNHVIWSISPHINYIRSYILRKTTLTVCDYIMYTFIRWLLDKLQVYVKTCRNTGSRPRDENTNLVYSTGCRLTLLCYKCEPYAMSLFTAWLLVFLKLTRSRYIVCLSDYWHSVILEVST